MVVSLYQSGLSLRQLKGPVSAAEQLHGTSVKIIRLK